MIHLIKNKIHFSLKIVLVFYFFSIISFNSNAYKLGSFNRVGTGCSGESKLIEDKDNLKIPLFLSINTPNQSLERAFERKTCQFTLPIQLEKNEKLQLVDISQKIKLIAPKGYSIKSELSAYFVGSKFKTPLVLEVQDSEKNETLKSKNLDMVSDCGKDVILKGSLNAFVKKQSNEQNNKNLNALKDSQKSNSAASVSSEELLIQLKSLTCN